MTVAEAALGTNRPVALLSISQRLYRWHLIYPDFLPTLLARAGEVLVDMQVEWQVLEGESPYLCSEIDFELYHPAQRPLGSQVDWQLSGCATAALLALRLLAEHDERHILKGGWGA